MIKQAKTIIILILINIAIIQSIKTNNIDLKTLTNLPYQELVSFFKEKNISYTTENQSNSDYCRNFSLQQDKNNHISIVCNNFSTDKHSSQNQSHQKSQQENILFGDSYFYKNSEIEKENKIQNNFKNNNDFQDSKDYIQKFERRKLAAFDNSATNYFISCTASIASTSDLPSDAQALTSKNFYANTQTVVSKTYPADCTANDNSIVNIYLVAQGTQVGQCQNLELTFSNSCTTYQPTVNINPLYVTDATTYQIGVTEILLGQLKLTTVSSTTVSLNYLKITDSTSVFSISTATTVNINNVNFYKLAPSASYLVTLTSFTNLNIDGLTVDGGTYTRIFNLNSSGLNVNVIINNLIVQNDVTASVMFQGNYGVSAIIQFNDLTLKDLTNSGLQTLFQTSPNLGAFTMTDYLIQNSIITSALIKGTSTDHPIIVNGGYISDSQIGVFISTFSFFTNIVGVSIDDLEVYDSTIYCTLGNTFITGTTGTAEVSSGQMTDINSQNFMDASFSTFTLKDCTFENVVLSTTNLIKIGQTDTTTIENFKLINVSGSTSHLFSIPQSLTLTITDSTFQQINTSTFAVFYFQIVQNLVISGSIFSGGTSSQNFYFADSSSLISVRVSDNQISDLTVTGKGGFMFFEKASLITLQNNQFTNVISTVSGAVFYLTATTNAITSTNDAFVNVQGLSGSIFYIEKLSNAITISQASVSQSSASSFGYFLYFVSGIDNLLIDIQDSTFQDNQSDQGGLYASMSGFNNAQVISANNQILENQCSTGCGFYIAGADFTSNNDIYSQNAVTNLGGAIYLTNTKIVSFTDLTVSKNSGAEATGVYVKSTNSVTITNVQSFENESNDGTIIYIETSTFSLTDSDFTDNNAQQGSAIYVVNAVTATVEDCTFINNKGYQAPLVMTSSILNTLYTIQNLDFSGNQIEELASGIQLNNIYFFTIQHITFLNEVNNGKSGAVLQGSNVMVLYDFTETMLGNPSFQINDITVDQNSGTSGGGISIQGALDCINCSLYDITYTNGFSSSYNQYQSIIMIDNTDNMEIYDIYFEEITQNNLIYIDSCTFINIYNINCLDHVNYFNPIYSIISSTDITLKDTNITNVESDQSPAIYVSQSSGLIFENIIIQNVVNSGQKGAGFKIDSSQNIEIENSSIKDCFADSAPGLYFTYSTDIQINNVNITDNESSKAVGAIHVSEQTTISFTSVQVNRNVAGSSQGGAYFSVVKGLNILDCEFNDNQSSSTVGGLEIDDCETIFINNTKILNNKSYKESGGIKIQYGDDLTFTNSEVISNTLDLGYGGGVYIFSTNNFAMENITVSENSADYGGGLCFETAKNIVLTGLTLENNNGYQIGGGIYGLNIDNLQIESCEFNSNEAQTFYGGGIYIGKTSYDIKVSETQFTNNKANLYGGGIYATFLDSITLNKATFEKNIAADSGAGLYLESVEALYLQYTEINQQNADYGGSLYTSNTDKIEISNCVLEENHAHLSGGSLYFLNSDEITIESTDFNYNTIILETQDEQYEQNQLSSYGGSIFVSTANQFTLSSSNLLNSYAYYKGGGIYLQDIIKVNIQNSIFKNNTVEENIDYDISQKDQNYLISKGGAIYYKYKSDNNINSVKLNFKDSQFESCKASSGGAILIEKNQEQKFSFNFEDLIFNKNQADLGPAIRLLGTFTESNEKNVENSASGANNKGILDSKQVFIGYYYNENLIKEDEADFELCYSGQFLLEGGQYGCETCLENGVCQGGYQNIQPAKGYWRENVNSLDFYYCQENPDACLGDECLDMYMGVKCEDCDLEKNANSDGNNCVECDSRSSILFQQFMKGVFVICVVFSSVMSLNYKLNALLLRKVLFVFEYYILRENQISIIIKIFITHNQILTFGSQLAGEIPDNILNTVNFFGNPISNLSKSLECLLTYHEPKDQYMIIFQSQLLGFGISLIILSCILAVTMIMVLVRFLPRIHLKSSLISAAVCFFINFQPGTLEIALKFLFCQNIGGVSYPYFSSAITCDDSFYIYTVRGVFIAVIFLIVLIIPGLIFWSMRSYSRQGLLYTSFKVQRSLGVYYIELKQNRYYWEFVWMILKVATVILANIYQSEGTEQIIKTASISAMVVIYAYLVLHFRPYQSQRINQLSIQSSFILGITLSLGLCIDQGEATEKKAKQKWKYLRQIVHQYKNFWNQSSKDESNFNFFSKKVYQLYKVNEIISQASKRNDFSEQQRIEYLRKGYYNIQKKSQDLAYQVYKEKNDKDLSNSSIVKKQDFIKFSKKELDDQIKKRESQNKDKQFSAQAYIESLKKKQKVKQLKEVVFQAQKKKQNKSQKSQKHLNILLQILDKPELLSSSIDTQQLSQQISQQIFKSDSYQKNNLKQSQFKQSQFNDSVLKSDERNGQDTQNENNENQLNYPQDLRNDNGRRKTYEIDGELYDIDLQLLEEGLVSPVVKTSRYKKDINFKFSQQNIQDSQFNHDNLDNFNEEAVSPSDFYNEDNIYSANGSKYQSQLQLKSKNLQELDMLSHRESNRNLINPKNLDDTYKNSSPTKEKNNQENYKKNVKKNNTNDIDKDTNIQVDSNSDSEIRYQNSNDNTINNNNNYNENNENDNIEYDEVMSGEIDLDIDQSDLQSPSKNQILTSRFKEQKQFNIPGQESNSSHANQLISPLNSLMSPNNLLESSSNKFKFSTSNNNNNNSTINEKADKIITQSNSNNDFQGKTMESQNVNKSQFQKNNSKYQKNNK
ncbi:Pectin lyase fold/virulence factor [Pseudocohnilembus persalinus]|uniref:Pectin lyase fold/virulence factor n=1 Tax=Pseudocohnilembus persalinus TaxID=266149 RepID=A0A0V0QHV7_PSEPJ|nr:Pectin lyase fold/virulence factor [Pseudocohnilembus persalinus]|eukprot:KRX01774.1 Pectin lyase fold/virulence factor [Pseudocohnilembus persalinus]